jgi:predicted TIM-barrel fold metal-dependent hydrolase
MQYEIIDFHTHPFPSNAYNICNHVAHCNMSVENTKKTMNWLGISKICGSVIENAPLRENETWWDRVRACNDHALRLREIYGDFYTPGFHVHPDFPEESMAEIDRMHEKGVKLIGELVPYMMGYRQYHAIGLDKIIDYATEKGMIVSIHTTENDEDIDAFVAAHPDTTIVAAHPGEFGRLMRHIERMKRHPNYYIDLSGSGTFRHGMIKRAVDEVGAHRILFGSDFPTCSPAMFLGSVVFEELLTEQEKQAILAGNAKRLLGL